MNDINNWTLTGRLTRPVEVKEVSNGWVIYTFDLANGYSEKDREGKWKQNTNFFRCKMFRKGTDFAQYLQKGQQVAVSGHARQETWGNNGGKRSAVICIVDSLILGERQRNEKPQQRGGLPVDENMNTQPNDGEIPF